MQSNKSILHNSEYDGASFTLEGSSTGILLFHGFTATTHEVRGLAEFIHTNTGFTVDAPLLPGHGTSPQDLAQTDFQQWLEAAEKSLAVLQKKADRILVSGESMGGLLALYLAAEHPEILGVMVYAPALVIPDLWKAKLLYPLFFSSPKKLKPTRPGFLPWQGYKVNPLKAVVELGKLQFEVHRILYKIHQPLLVIQGLQDETIDIRSSRMVYDSISSTWKELVELENCGHGVLLDKLHETVFATSVAFIRSITE